MADGPNGSRRMIPKKIHFYWEGPYDQDVIHNIWSFQSYNPSYEIKCWNEKEVRDLSPNIDWAKRAFPHQAGLSNYVRLVLLSRLGGFWFDTDFICHKPIDQFLEHEAVAAFQDKGRICNAFMGAVAGHPWIEWQLRNANQYEGYQPEWGVYLATEAPRDGLTIIPSELVYPYLYDTPRDKCLINEDTVVEHQWKGSWL